MTSPTSDVNQDVGMTEELDSNFFIFLPHVFTSDPVADIEKGARFSCFVGELLDFFLIAQHRSINHAEGSRWEVWRRTLERISSSVSVSCVDLATSKGDEVSCNGFISCCPATSSRYQKDVQPKKPLEPTITSRGDIVFPLHVSLDALPAMTRRIRLSVNVWTPELGVSYLSNGQDKSDFIDSTVYHDPEEDRQVMQTAFRCHVNASLPIVASPTVQCKYMHVRGRHYLCVEVANSLGETMKIHHLRVHSTLDVTPQNIRYSNTHIKSSAQRMFDLDVFPVTLDEGESELSCVMLQPWEQNCCIFQVVYHEKQIHRKSLEVALTTSVTWSVDTLQSRDQTITTHYSMPVFNIRRSSVSLHAACPSMVVKGDRLLVKYTVTNMEREDCNVFLIWMPDEESAACKVSTGALVCLQPLIRIGYCASGSSHTVYIEFLAVEGGLHEVGKHMLCKQYADIGKADFFTDMPDPRHITTVSHSCQVYVMPASTRDGSKGGQE